MKKISPIITFLTTVVTFIVAKYKLAAMVLSVLIFLMILEQISWNRVINRIRKENKKLDGKKMVFKNPLHYSKIDSWLIISAVMVVEAVSCYVSGKPSYFIGSAAVMIYYAITNFSSLCANISFFREGDMVLKLLQKLSNKIINSFGIAIDIVEEKADSIISKENIEKIVTATLEKKFGKGIVSNENSNVTGEKD